MQPQPPFAHPNLIFDLGAVIINLDFGRTARRFSELSGLDFADLYAHHQQLPFFDEFEVGRLSPEGFRAALRQALAVPHAPDHLLDEHWNALLLDLPAERIELLKRLGQTRRLFLLSNTNAIHKTAFDQIMAQQHQMPTIDSLFERAYYSHLVQDRKPNLSIFARVLAENGLKPEETLFIDDTIRHVEGARRAGLAAYHLVAPQTVLDLF
jgi:glucose-1-phosphatase